MRQAIHVVHVKEGHVRGAPDAEDMYFFKAPSKDREEATHVCKAFL
jgi:hypothetical protein